MKLDEESSYKTTFASPYGRYRYLRLPFGIKSAPEVCHRTVADLFSDIEGVETYIDDFIIHGSTEEQHDQRLRQVLDRCRKVNLKLNLSICLPETDNEDTIDKVVQLAQKAGVVIDANDISVAHRLPGNRHANKCAPSSQSLCGESSEQMREGEPSKHGWAESLHHRRPHQDARYNALHTNGGKATAHDCRVYD